MRKLRRIVLVFGMVLVLIVGTPLLALAGEKPNGKPFQAIWEELEEHEAILANHSAEIEDIQTQITDLQEQIDDLQGQIDYLQKQLNGEEAARKAADNQLQANIDAEEAARIAADNALVPRGVIAMWSGKVTHIPDGWALCDGKTYTAPNGDSVQTPDLSGQFVVGYDASDADYNALGKTGGEKEHTLIISEMPRHAHFYSGSVDYGGTHSHGYLDIYDTGNFGSSGGWAVIRLANQFHAYRKTEPGGDHTHTYSGNTDLTGGDQPHENRPPYFTVAYIMKL